MISISPVYPKHKWLHSVEAEESLLAASINLTKSVCDICYDVTFLQWAYAKPYDDKDQSSILKYRYHHIEVRDIPKIRAWLMKPEVKDKVDLRQSTREMSKSWTRNCKNQLLQSLESARHRGL